MPPQGLPSDESIGFLTKPPVEDGLTPPIAPPGADADLPNAAFCGVF